VGASRSGPRERWPPTVGLGPSVGASRSGPRERWPPTVRLGYRLYVGGRWARQLG